ncbi:hypothetical protein BDR05DRAFT_1006300 [Suillus weaverae]|nr:hypothetical protein BDR05DRAFT_1006300 [Suillus weaverae]
MFRFTSYHSSTYSNLHILAIAPYGGIELSLWHGVRGDFRVQGLHRRMAVVDSRTMLRFIRITSTYSNVLLSVESGHVRQVLTCDVVHMHEPLLRFIQKSSFDGFKHIVSCCQSLHEIRDCIEPSCPPQNTGAHFPLRGWTSVEFVDSSIVGGPPKGDENHTFYSSAEDVKIMDEFTALSKYGLKVSPLKGEGTGVGDTSALKISYAENTKGRARLRQG